MCARPPPTARASAQSRPAPALTRGACADGGSSQMTDILTRADALRKHTFDIQARTPAPVAE